MIDDVTFLNIYVYVSTHMIASDDLYFLVLFCWNIEYIVVMAMPVQASLSLLTHFRSGHAKDKRQMHLPRSTKLTWHPQQDRHTLRDDTRLVFRRDPHNAHDWDKHVHWDMFWVKDFPSFASSLLAYFELRINTFQADHVSLSFLSEW